MIDQRLIRLRVELFTAAQTLKGDSLTAFKELIRDISVVMDAHEDRPDCEPLVVPPVDRSDVTTTDGRPAHEVKLEQRGEPGMHRSYIVLSDSERAKGFVRPVRKSYVHEKCGGATTMGIQIAETYARDPAFYGATFCCKCGGHYPVGSDGEFIWDDGTKVGS